jgi:hypothetical protein
MGIPLSLIPAKRPNWMASHRQTGRPPIPGLTGALNEREFAAFLGPRGSVSCGNAGGFSPLRKSAMERTPTNEITVNSPHRPCYFETEAAFMRTITLVSITLATLAISVIGTRAEGSWCATYGGNGGVNCGFYSYQQCVAAISGNGGFCSQNGFYGTARDSRRRR